MANRLYVGNLNYQTTQDTLGRMFAEYGDVAEVTVIDGKGFAFVEYVSGDSTKEAIEKLNGADVDGRQIRVDIAHERQERRGGTGGHRSGDRW